VTLEENVLRVESICRDQGHVIEVKPIRSLPVGIVTTGSEVFHGRIEDKFGPVLRVKLAELGCPVVGQVFVSDDADETADAIRRYIAAGAEMVAVTGGMSVDPDDRTPTAIRKTGARVITYGAPVFPGAMFMLAYLDSVPILGLPGCVMYHRTSIFDLVVPRILAGENITREDLIDLGHGGFCSGCATCTYPRCGFGK
jgi:molybdenum cofactor synthesis domain-containing protein